MLEEKFFKFEKIDVKSRESAILVHTNIIQPWVVTAARPEYKHDSIELR